MSEIQDLNPALLKPIAPAGYQLRVPKGTLTTIMAPWTSFRQITVPSGGFTVWSLVRRWPRSRTAIATSRCPL